MFWFCKFLGNLPAIQNVLHRHTDLIQSKVKSNQSRINPESTQFFSGLSARPLSRFPLYRFRLQGWRRWVSAERLLGHPNILIRGSYFMNCATFVAISLMPPQDLSKGSRTKTKMRVAPNHFPNIYRAVKWRETVVQKTGPYFLRKKCLWGAILPNLQKFLSTMVAFWLVFPKIESSHQTFF